MRTERGQLPLHLGRLSLVRERPQNEQLVVLGLADDPRILGGRLPIRPHQLNNNVHELLTV